MLSDVSFTLNAGEALIIRGPNGIGKTTFLRAVAGLIPLTSGTITAPDIAFSGHADAIKSAMTVAENLTFWAKVFGTSAHLDQVLQDFDLTTHSDRPAGNMSAGQKRRLGLARLVITQRKLWVMDEPTVSLDAFSVKLLVQVMQRHLGQGGMILASTHVGLPIDARTLDLSDFRATETTTTGFDEAFL